MISQYAGGFMQQTRQTWYLIVRYANYSLSIVPRLSLINDMLSTRKTIIAKTLFRNMYECV